MAVASEVKTKTREILRLRCDEIWLTDFSTFFESSLNPGEFCIFGVFQYFLSKMTAQVTVAAT